VSHYDVIVVGSGAGGGVIAGTLAEAGRSVLLLERGDLLLPSDMTRSHLRNGRLQLYGDGTRRASDRHPRVLVSQNGERHVVEPTSSLHHHNATVVGGGTLVWGMQAWRFHPDDFRMASLYGIPQGSSLADWPISYADLEPYYSRAEMEIGVAGDEVAMSYAPRSTPYPLPTLDRTPAIRWLSAGAHRLGWSTVTPPLALNSKPYQGRGSCIRCNECVGFACPTNAKNGSHNTLVTRALATGNCFLVTRAQATRVTTNSVGHVDGVEYVCNGERKLARSKVVVIAAGAIESARLLLLSSSKHHRAGIGNASGHVGRHLQGHTYPAVLGTIPREEEHWNRGPGAGIATADFVHGNPGIIGGALVGNDFVKTPISFWTRDLPPDVRRWGKANKQAMRDLFPRVVDLRGPVHEIPTPDARVQLDSSVRDAAGLAVAHLSGTTHPETFRTARFIQGEARRWLEASGADRIWSRPLERRLSAGQHQAGTCRMSLDPTNGVTDPSGRVHGHDNLFIGDGSIHVTNGGFNPALTIFALAFRTGDEVTAYLS
jgi:choline dehydrogenase-like flavoprotein